MGSVRETVTFLLTTPALAAAQPQVPAGFIAAVMASGLHRPAALSFAPGGRLLFHSSASEYNRISRFRAAGDERGAAAGETVGRPALGPDDALRMRLSRPVSGGSERASDPRSRSL